MTKPTILVLLGCFNRTTEASGPTQSLLGNVRALADDFSFRVVGHADEGEEVMRWHRFAGIDRIAVPGQVAPVLLSKILNSTQRDLLILNGFFDRRLTIPALVMRRLGIAATGPTLLAPRGEFSAGALAIKPTVKKLHLAAVRATGLVNDVHFQATDPLERAAILDVLPNAHSILIGPNVRAHAPSANHVARLPGQPLRIVFLSRIDRKKNLHRAIAMLRACTEPLQFDIIGPITNSDYWRECNQQLQTLGPHIKHRYLGPVAPEAVVETLARYDLFFFPTAGENYGHAIVDSLFAGTPVLISDQTPWTGLAEAKAGASLELQDDNEWARWIDEFARLGPSEMGRWRLGARAYIERAVDSETDTLRLKRCFETAISTHLEA